MKSLTTKRLYILASLVLFIILSIITVIVINQKIVSRDREIFLATASTTTDPISSQEYSTLAQPTRELPENVRNHPKLQGRYGYTSYGDDYGNLYAQVFHSKSPLWKCDLYFINGNDVISLDRARAKFLNCFDIYTDGLGSWYAVDPGYVGIQGETRVYRLTQDKVIKIYGLEELRGLNLYFDSKRKQWFGRSAQAGATVDDVSTFLWHTINFPLLAGDTPHSPLTVPEVTPTNPTLPTTPSISTPDTVAPSVPLSSGTSSAYEEPDFPDTPTPEPFPARFISSVIWPPVVATSTKSTASQPFMCPDTQSTKRLIEGREYCITITTEGAAGSIFKNFTYLTYTDTYLVTASFVLRFPNCQNFDSPDSEMCTTEQTNFNIDNLVATQIRQ